MPTQAQPLVLVPFIDGVADTPSSSGAQIALVSPNRGETYALMLDTPAGQVQAAVASAQRAYLAHRRVALAQRAAWLHAAAAALEAAVPELVEMLIADIGKPRRAAQFEAQRSAAMNFISVPNITAASNTSGVLAFGQWECPIQGLGSYGGAEVKKPSSLRSTSQHPAFSRRERQPGPERTVTGQGRNTGSDPDHSQTGSAQPSA